MDTEKTQKENKVSWIVTAIIVVGVFLFFAIMIVFKDYMLEYKGDSFK